MRSFLLLPLTTSASIPLLSYDFPFLLNLQSLSPSSSLLLPILIPHLLPLFDASLLTRPSLKHTYTHTYILQREQVNENKSVRQPAGVRDGLEKALDSVTREVRTYVCRSSMTHHSPLEMCIIIILDVETWRVTWLSLIWIIWRFMPSDTLLLRGYIRLIHSLTLSIVYPCAPQQWLSRNLNPPLHRHFPSFFLFLVFVSGVQRCWDCYLCACKRLHQNRARRILDLSGACVLPSLMIWNEMLHSTVLLSDHTMLRYYQLCLTLYWCVVTHRFFTSHAMACHAMPCHAMSVASYDIILHHVLTVIVHNMVTNHTSPLSSPYSSLFSIFSLLSALFHSPFCLQVRALPIAVLRPTAGAAEALSYALLGE